MNNMLWLAFAQLVLAAVIGAGAPSAMAATPSRLESVRRWLPVLDVNLTEDTVARMVDSDYDLIVLDFVPSEKHNVAYPIADVVGRLHSAPKPKLVLAYVDIGQAERYRTYWQPSWRIGSPDWIVGDDPDGWTDNYPVAFWRDAWRRIWLGESGYLGSIVNAGFDGLYMDWVEAYSDDRVVALAGRDGVEPRGEMVRFVADIARFGRDRRPGFLVIGQNAAELALEPNYMATIDAISQEQVWFDGAANNQPPGDCPLPATDADIDSAAYQANLPAPCRAQYDTYTGSTLHMSTAHYLNQLAVARERGKVVFTLDYALQPDNVRRVYAESRGRGYVPFVGSRHLNEFVAPVP